MGTATGTAASEERRNALWNALLDAEMNTIYWTLMSHRYSQWDKYFKIGIAMATSGTVAAWGIWSAYPLGWKVLSAAACVSSIIHPFICNNEQLKRMTRLVSDWKELEIKYELLWTNDSFVRAEESWKKFEKNKQSESRIDEAKLPSSVGLLKEAARRVRRARGLPEVGQG